MSYVPPGAEPDTLQVSKLLVIRFAFTAGTPGTADDVQVMTPMAFDYRVLSVDWYLSTTIALATLQLRSLPGNTGTIYSGLIGASLVGAISDTARTSTQMVTAGTSLYVRRSNRGVAGEVVILITRPT